MSVRSVLLLSGPLAVGKTAVRVELMSAHGFGYVRSSEYLRGIAKAERLAIERGSLQYLGDRLDVTTDYRWLIDDVARPAIEGNLQKALWIVDAVRKVRQIEHFRSAFASAVYHVHFTATEQELRRRYIDRQREHGSKADLTPYEVAIDHDNERFSRSLIDHADLVVDLTTASSREAADFIVKALKRRF